MKEEKFLAGDDEDVEVAVGEDGKYKSTLSHDSKGGIGTPTERGGRSSGASAGSLSSSNKSSSIATRRLSFENKKLGIERKVPPSMRKESIARNKQEQYLAVKDNFDLPFDVFMKCVLDFQLNAHENYLAGFKHIFRHYDDDGDGVLTSEQFRQCYIRLRTHGADAPTSRVSFADEEDDDRTRSSAANRWSKQEEKVFMGILSIIDPAETDRVTFSAAATCLNKIGKRTHAVATPTSTHPSEGSKTPTSGKK